MTTSESINELATALAKAQAQVSGAVKDSANPFFKSRYADLESVWTACRKPLTDNGLSIVQSPSTEVQGEGVRVSIETLLLHSSGQWIRGTVSVSAKEDSPQAVGSCISYLKRYALQSFAGVAPSDDDGEAAQGRSNGQHAQQRTSDGQQQPHGYVDWLANLWKFADKGTPALEAAWRASKPEYRSYLTTTAPKQWEDLKKRAAVLTNEVPA